MSTSAAGQSIAAQRSRRVHFVMLEHVSRWDMSEGSGQCGQMEKNMDYVPAAGSGFLG